jgi:hypothetical protein
MKCISEFINRPYPYEYDIKTIFKQNLGIGLFIFLFLAVFVPLETQKTPGSVPSALVIKLGFGLISFALGFAYDAFIPRLFPKLFFSGQGKFKHVIAYILGILVLIGLGNALYYHWTSSADSLCHDLFMFQLYTAAIGIIPVTFTVLFDQYWHLRQHIRNAEAINRELGNHRPKGINPSEEEESVTLTSNNRRETLSVPRSRLLFIKSAGNYIEVFTDENGRVKKHLLRNTIKRVDDHLGRKPFITRCHRAYLVNVWNIQKVTGDSQGFRVTVRVGGLEVPVSRGYLKQFRRHVDRMLVE